MADYLKIVCGKSELIVIFLLLDVKTPTTHTNRFEEYLKYVMEEDVYNPDIYGFTNGHLVISEIETTDGTLEAPDSAQ